MIPWTQTQAQRLNELNATDSTLKKTFDDKTAREKMYQTLEKTLVTTQRRKLAKFQVTHRRPELCRLEHKLADMLTKPACVSMSASLNSSRQSSGRRCVA